MNGYSSGPVTTIILPLTLVSEEVHFLQKALEIFPGESTEKSGLPLPFFKKNKTLKKIRPKRKNTNLQSKIKRFPQQKIRPNVLNARKDDCFQQDVSQHKGESGHGKGENLDGGYWTRIWVKVLPRLQ